jgi:hypothetical protein
MTKSKRSKRPNVQSMQKADDSAGTSDERSQVSKGAAPDAQGLPNEPGLVELQVVREFSDACPDCGAPCRHLELQADDEGPLYVALCDQMYWYRKGKET